ncbi:hypothetical protein MMC14_009768 [Varicellaria rhodocarpa]|nr:hypothetical protein [Varicellaria rhodocarpa]
MAPMGATEPSIYEVGRAAKSKSKEITSVLKRQLSESTEFSPSFPLEFAGTSGGAQTRTLGDDMIPSDAEVVPVEGVFRTGKPSGSLCRFQPQISDEQLPAGDKQKIRGKTVLVAGATGGVGSQVVQCLRNEGVKVRALVRDYTKALADFDNTNNVCNLRMHEQAQAASFHHERACAVRRSGRRSLKWN